MARRLLNEIEVRDHGALTMYPLDALLRGLAELDARPGAVVSLYLDSRWDDEHQRERARLGLRQAAARERERLRALPGEAADRIERDLARAEEYAHLVIKQRRDVGFEGIACFFSEPRGVDLVVLAHASMPTKLVVGPRPHLPPLVVSASEHDLALVAIVETDETRILEIATGGLFAHDRLEGDVPDRVQRGGWRQLRIQKHIADHIAHHHREGATDLMARFDAIAALRGRPPRVVLAGREPMLAGFERHLPERVLRRAIRATHVDPKLRTDQVLEIVRDALREAERRGHREALAAVVDAAAIGRGAEGLKPVLDAVNQGRLRELLLDRRFDAPGVECRRCGQLLEADSRASCPFCAGPLEPVSLKDELLRRAVLASAELHLVDEAGLPDGIAATLRY